MHLSWRLLVQKDSHLTGRADRLIVGRRDRQPLGIEAVGDHRAGDDLRLMADRGDGEGVPGRRAADWLDGDDGHAEFARVRRNILG